LSDVEDVDGPEPGMVKEGLALEALPWEAKALDGLELPITSSDVVLWNKDGT
jgi:hypothetical protein